ncbi:hypothetical protein I4U23_022460 [Adineta vaga]|nr:hypothetical protein I4U23_022460 [Adineta vaga]
MIDQVHSHLVRIVVNMSVAFQINIIQMEESLKCFPRLVQFAVECRSDIDLCDEEEWERCFLENNPYLQKFNFKFFN